MDDLKPCQLAILCVDDDTLILNSLSEQLSHHLGDEIAIEVAASGEEALQVLTLLQSEGMELVLLISDQQMVGMTGDQLLQQICHLSPKTLNVLLTGAHPLGALEEALNRAQLYRYISKPWDETDLVLTVKEAIRRYRQDEAIARHQAHLQAANAELASSVSLLQATLEATADGILVVNNMHQITHVNQKFLDLISALELPPGSPRSPTFLTQLQQVVEAPDSPWRKLLMLDEPSAQEQRTTEGWMALELSDGRCFECHGQLQRFNQQLVGWVWSIRDVTERHHTLELIQYQAHHDGLTGLFNRTQFMSQVEQLLRSEADPPSFAVMFVDLDHFKTVNDTLGHSVGDRLLQQVVQRIQNHCRVDDVIARWGGDEFTILVPQIRGRQDAGAIARRLLDSFQDCFEIEGHTIRTTLSIGIALYPEDGQTAEALLKYADAALYKAKETGKNNCQYYTIDLSDRAHERLRIETAMYQSLEANDFSLHYQPQIDTCTGQITHVEALIRWHHPTLGQIPPQTFIPIAEQNGLIVPLGHWILETALTQLKQWQDLGHSSLTLGVNLSARQLQSPNLLPILEHLLIQIGIAPQSLELEVTETLMVQDLAVAQALLTRFRQLGISIALDDFGSGYASLAYLLQLPFSTLKIDRCFIQQLAITASHQPKTQIPPPQPNRSAPATLQAQAIIEAMLALGRGLDMRVVAEGVETESQYKQLQSLGCRYIQGYYFSCPLPANQVSELLRSRVQAPGVQAPGVQASEDQAARVLAWADPGPQHSHIPQPWPVAVIDARAHAPGYPEYLDPSRLASGQPTNYT